MIIIPLFVYYQLYKLKKKKTINYGNIYLHSMNILILDSERVEWASGFIYLLNITNQV